MENRLREVLYIYRRQELELMIYCHHDAKKKLFELEMDTIHRAPVYDDLGVRTQKTCHADRTAQSAIEMAMDHQIMHLQKITRAIERMYDEASTEARKYIVARYWTKPPPKWTMRESIQWDAWVISSIRRNLEILDSSGKKQA